MEIQADISICTFTQKPGPILNRLLTSIYKAADPVSVEVIVVDQSTAEERSILCNFPDIIVYQAQKTENFAQAHNRAMSLATGRYIALIEEDVLISQDYLTETLTFLDNHPDVGIAGPRIWDANGRKEPSCRVFFSPLSLLANYTPLGQLKFGQRLINQHIMSDLPPDQSSEVDWICGGLHIIRRELFEEIGPLDEKLDLPFSEQDYYLRARQTGWHNMYCPMGEVLHDKPGRYHLDIQKRPYAWDILRNSILYFRKKWFHPRRNPG